jgi:hypothetical protein
MKLFVRLYADVAGQKKPAGIPDLWPADCEEVDDSAPDPEDGRLVMSLEEYHSYLATHRAAFEAWRDEAQLPEYRKRKIEAIDQKTVELIEQGFVFSSKTFSLSREAQLNLIAMEGKKSIEGAFPAMWNTLDDLDTLIINNVTVWDAFYETAFGTKRFHLESGTALKDTVRAAATNAELDDITDPR